MKKTSVYLEEDDRRRLAKLARQEGMSQAAVIRRAIASYVPRRLGDRDFALTGSGEGPGGTVADVPDEELLRGFGS
ncbi:MAG: CopG family transcriptional regulator [Actinomycetota bacterium]